MKLEHSSRAAIGRSNDGPDRRTPRPTVLVVDDEADVRLLIRVWFIQAGFRVLEAANGAEALALVDQGIDLVVTDLMMPVLDGGGFIATLRRTGSTGKVPVVVITARPQDGIEAEAVLLKPFSPSDLIEVAKSIIGDPV